MGDVSKVGAAGQSRAVPEQKKTKVSSKEQKEKIDNIFKATAEKVDKIKSDAEINAAKAARKSANDDALKLRNRNTALITMKNKSYKNIDLNLAQTEKNLTAINNRYADVELKLRANRQLALKIHNDKDATEFQKAAYEKASSAVNDALHELKIITGQEIDAADLKLDENGRLVGKIKRSGKLTSEQIEAEKKAFSGKKSTDKSVTFSDKTLKHYAAVHHKQSEQEKAVREQALTKMGESSAEAKTVTDNVKNLETKRAERAKMSKEIREKSNEKVVAVVQSTVADLEKTETGKEPVKKEDKTGASSKPGKDAASAAKEALEKTKSEQGPIGKLWSGIKNFTGIGASSDKAENAIKDFENGKITREEMEKAVKNYQEGQEEALDLVADVGAGIISAGLFTVCAGAGLVAAPVTGGASLGLVFGGFGLSASVGAVAKTGIKAGDAHFGGRKYDSLGYDLATGAAGGVFAPFTAGLGGATAKKVGTYCVKKGMTAAKARVAAKLANVAGMSAGGAIDGGTYSAAAYVTGDAENKNLVDFSKEVAKGAKVGAVAGPVVGGAFHGLGKLYTKGASAVKKLFGKSGSGSAGSAAKPGLASGSGSGKIQPKPAPQPNPAPKKPVTPPPANNAGVVTDQNVVSQTPKRSQWSLNNEGKKTIREQFDHAVDCRNTIKKEALNFAKLNSLSDKFKNLSSWIASCEENIADLKYLRTLCSKPEKFAQIDKEISTLTCYYEKFTSVLQDLIKKHSPLKDNERFFDVLCKSNDFQILSDNIPESVKNKKVISDAIKEATDRSKKRQSYFYDLINNSNLPRKDEFIIPPGIVDAEPKEQKIVLDKFIELRDFYLSRAKQTTGNEKEACIAMVDRIEFNWGILNKEYTKSLSRKGLDSGLPYFEAYYDSIRICEENYYVKSAKSLSSIDQITGKGSDSVGVLVENGWHFRTPQNRQIKPAVDRISLNVSPEKELIEKLDDFVVRNPSVINYKTPKSFSGWFDRHDPITIYFSDWVPDSVKQDIAKLVKPYVRKTTNPATAEKMIGTKIADGVYSLPEPDSTACEKLMKRAEKIDPYCAAVLEPKLYRKGSNARIILFDENGKKIPKSSPGQIEAAKIWLGECEKWFKANGGQFPTP